MHNNGEYIVYVDESGDHNTKSIDHSFPVFVLAFCIFEKQKYTNEVTQKLQQLKFKYFGHDAIVLHEHAIRKSKGPFRILLDSSIRAPFLEDLNVFIRESKFTIIATGIDKHSFVQRYKNRHNLYSVAVNNCLARLDRFLSERGEDKVTHVIFEERGKKEDGELELAFRRSCDNKDYSVPFEIIFANKKINSCGLQVADLVARPIGRHLISPDQENRAYGILSQKFYKDINGHIENYGLTKIT